MNCTCCGTELEAGARFCCECGADVPQVKACVKCGVQLPLNAKFCSQCGMRQDGGAAARGGLAMGDKNVVAGDVIGSKEETHIAGHATIIKNVDETKKTDTCHQCGNIVVVLDGYQCTRCNSFTCRDCYDTVRRSCHSCLEQELRKKEGEYLLALEAAYADGVISALERTELKALQKRNGLSDERARQLEEQLLVSHGIDSSLTTADELALKKAYNLFYYEVNQEHKALALLEPLHEVYAHDKAVLDLYLSVLARQNPDYARKVATSLSVDNLQAYLVQVEMDLGCNDLSSAEKVLRQAKRLWPSQNNYLVFWEGMLYFRLYKTYSDHTYLEKTKELCQGFVETDDPVDLTQQIFLQKICMDEVGEDTQYLTRSFFDDNGLMGILFFRLLEWENLLEDAKELEVFRIKNVYNEDGFIIREERYGRDGSLLLAKDGVAVIEFQYDENGVRIGMECYDTNRKLILDTNGVAIYKQSVDEWGNPVCQSFYGVDGTLCLNSDGVASIRSYYDKKGNEVRRKHYGTNNQLKPDNQGVAVLKFQYNASGQRICKTCYGVDNRIKADKEGVAIYKYQFDDAGNRILQEHYGVDNKPVADDNGVAAVRWLYDDTGKLVEFQLYDVNGALLDRRSCN